MAVYTRQTPTQRETPKWKRYQMSPHGSAPHAEVELSRGGENINRLTSLISLAFMESSTLKSIAFSVSVELLLAKTKPTATALDCWTDTRGSKSYSQNITVNQPA